MSHELRREYLNAIRERYNKSARSKKSLILDEFCSVCGYARKYAIAILNGHVEPCDQKPRGRQVKYTTEVVFSSGQALERHGDARIREAKGCPA